MQLDQRSSEEQVEVERQLAGWLGSAGSSLVKPCAQEAGSAGIAGQAIGLGEPLLKKLLLLHAGAS